MASYVCSMFLKMVLSKTTVLSFVLLMYALVWAVISLSGAGAVEVQAQLNDGIGIFRYPLNIYYNESAITVLF